jgi:CopG family transcriptional regulator/antitoxin EndoAI
MAIQYWYADEQDSLDNPPTEMLTRAEELARQENRTMSELIREALRHYERSQWWNRMNAYGRLKADERGLTEADAVSAVKAVRRVRARKRLNQT